MSLPSFPKVDPPIERENAVNQILSSIAMEELGLSHILNAEGEKLQYILGTLPGLSGPSATVGDVLTATESVRSMLETAVQNQLFLKAKMQGALAASPMQGPTGPTGLPVTATSAYLASISGQTISVLADGAVIPMSEVMRKSLDIKSTPTGTQLTVNTPGRYLISYNVNTSVPSNAGTRLMINGKADPASVIAPSIAVSPTVLKSHFSAEIIVDLTAGSTVSLQMFGPLANITLLPGSGGANLSVIRLS